MYDHDYITAIADARFVLRRAFRLVDEQARVAGIDPLHFQALVQIAGAEHETLQITKLAERLDVTPALVSRMARDLEERGCVERASSVDDRRVTLLRLTESGSDLVDHINRAIVTEFELLRIEISPQRREVAMQVFAANLGVKLEGLSV
jgi:DNA-binding MarR family transcriptional regulator